MTNSMIKICKDLETMDIEIRGRLKFTLQKFSSGQFKMNRLPSFTFLGKQYI